MANILDIRDAFIGARAGVAEAIEEALMDFYEPQLKLDLALRARLMPPEAWDLLDEQTKSLMQEVLNGKAR